jgi:5,10-methylenetetrahydrofolate reductase
MKISFEFFPPRTEQGKQALTQVRKELSTISPEYFSVTFGAGGSTQDATLETVLDIQQNDGVPAAPHLSCIGSEKIKSSNCLINTKSRGSIVLLPYVATSLQVCVTLVIFITPMNW